MNQKIQEFKDENLLKVARDREDRLQRSIQSTLKNLGKRVDSSHRKIDDRRSLIRPNSGGRHPEEPNKFWPTSMQQSRAPIGKRIDSKIGFDEDNPRATNFPDFDDFLGRAPDDKDALNGSTSSQQNSGGKSSSFGQSPVQNEYQEDDNKSAQVISLNKDKNDDSMDFDDPVDQYIEPQLTVNLANLLGSSTSDEAQNVTNQSLQVPRQSTRKSKRASQLGREQYGSTLFDFFKSLDYTPGVGNNQGTVRASYKSGRGSYNLYGVPGAKPGDKGNVYIQSQDGFDKDLPPVRLSDKKRDQLINNFEELQRLTSQDDQSENDVLYEESTTKKEIPNAPNHQNNNKDNILKNNKKFGSSGIENGKPVNVPLLKQKKPHEKQFQSEFNRLMGYEETVTPGGGSETPEIEDQETPGGSSSNKSIFQTVYSGMLSSIYGGFGGFQANTPQGNTPQGNDLPNDQKPTLKQHHQPTVFPISKLLDQRAPRALSPDDEWKRPQKLPPTKDKSPMLGIKPNHPRFNRQPEGRVKVAKPKDDPFNHPPFQQQQPLEPESSHKSFKSDSSSLRKARQPMVMKLTSEDFDSKHQPPIDILPKSFTPAESLYKHYDPYAPQQFPQSQNNIDPNMPNVIILVADNVKLIRNNAVPMLQVQLEIIQSAMNYDSNMCMLGLNDVIYIVPEYTVSEYDNIYSRICTGEEYYEFKNFFEHYRDYRYNPQNDGANLPERMVGLNKNCMIAIDRDHYEPDLRGKAFINLKNVPNGHYTIFYLRIGQPISINSRLKVLGKAKNIYVNINRNKIVECYKPQLDLNHSSSRISRRETSKFKIMKAQQSKKRDNQILSLNSDDEGEGEETEQPLQQILEKKADEELKKLKSSEGTRDDSKDDAGLDMEFYDESVPTQGKKTSGSGTPTKVQPPSLQDSKEYYNSTQRMTEAMIKNPQFQIFSIDEEESIRTSMRESIDIRQSIDSFKGYPPIPDQSEDEYYVPKTPDVPTPHPDAPEDAFRNVHRHPNDDYTMTSNNLPQPSAKDLISKQIEDYQMNSLAQLANFMASEPSTPQSASRKVQTPQQQEQYKPPQVHEVIPPLQIASQRSQKEIFQSRRDSVKSGRSNTSVGSKRITRMKTISLKELEDPVHEPQTTMKPGQPRDVSPDRSNSLNDGQRKIIEIQVKQRSSSSKKGRGSQREEDPFKQDMGETTKGNPTFLHQQMQARQMSRGRSASIGIEQSNQSNEGGNRRPQTRDMVQPRPSLPRSKSRPQSSSKPFSGIMTNKRIPQTITEKIFDRYGNPLSQPDEDMRPKSQAQPMAHEADNSLRPVSRGKDSGRNRFFHQRSESQGSNGSAGRRRQSLSNTNLGQQQKPNRQFNENFSDDGSPVRADTIQNQQERKMGRGKRF